MFYLTYLLTYLLLLLTVGCKIVQMFGNQNRLLVGGSWDQIRLHIDKILFTGIFLDNLRLTRMWANAQRDGRPAEYRWRPLFNAAKFGWRPLLECRAVTLSRRETRWNFLGCPKLTKRSQPLVGRSSPHCKDMWGRYGRHTISDRWD